VITSKLTQTFSFGKLRNQINDILDNIMDGIGETASKNMISRIEKGLKPKLADYTLTKDKVLKVNRLSNKPLMRTGALLKSLKYDKSKNHINMLAYGKEQNDGFKNPWGVPFNDIPPRKFMDFGIKDTKKEIKSKLYLEIKKALKK
tara:strand:+ start:195 stop:632 length:438 start_codon:yes stop_codon:yes gene_type:complete